MAADRSPEIRCASRPISREIRADLRDQPATISRRIIWILSPHRARLGGSRSSIAGLSSDPRTPTSRAGVWPNSWRSEAALLLAPGERRKRPRTESGERYAKEPSIARDRDRACRLSARSRPRRYDHRAEILSKRTCPPSFSPRSELIPSSRGRPRTLPSDRDAVPPPYHPSGVNEIEARPSRVPDQFLEAWIGSQESSASTGIETP